MSEVSSPRLGDDADSNYTAPDIEDDQGEDDDDLAEMFAKVQRFQETECRRPTIVPAEVSPQDDSSTRSAGDKRNHDTASPPVLIVQVNEKAFGASARLGSAKSRSPSASTLSSRSSKNYRDEGIKTITRRSSRGNIVTKDALFGPRKPHIYNEHILQSVLTTADTLERLKKQAVAAPPAKIKERIEKLSAPEKKDLGRRFATDDEERHCRFKAKKGGAKKANDDYDGDSQDQSSNFIARMEATERNRQKKLETARGENEYNARLDKKCCPKCGIPQSYSEFHDKKKKCQTCGVEFRILQAWGDVGHEFIARMSDAVRSQTEKKEQLRAQVLGQETQRNRVPKTARQKFYEKQMVQKNSQRTFLDRNYRPSSSSKVKQAEEKIQAWLGSKKATA